MFEMHPIGHVNSDLEGSKVAAGGTSEVCIELIRQMEPECLTGIEQFSHVLVIYYHDRIDPVTICRGARHPDHYPKAPAVGVYAQTCSNRPNRMGASIVRVVRHDQRRLYVHGLDVANNAPVLDIRPVSREWLPAGPVDQPYWIVPEG